MFTTLSKILQAMGYNKEGDTLHRTLGEIFVGVLRQVDGACCAKETGAHVRGREPTTEEPAYEDGREG